MDSRAPIGIFDSGVGGLSVYREIRKLLPHENLLYFGDTKRAPYGVRSVAQIQDFTREILQFLEQNQVKAAVAACNTITVNLASLPSEFSFPILGMSQGASQAAALSQTGNIAVLGTNATIHSGKHLQALHHIAPSLKVYPIACPRFAPLVEAGAFTGSLAEEAVEEYVRPLRAAQVDVVILACTHYPFLKDLLQRALPAAHFLDPAQETAAQLQLALQKQHLSNHHGQGYDKLFFSGNTQSGLLLLRQVQLQGKADIASAQLPEALSKNESKGGLVHVVC